jgi:hypothetical protein
METQEINIDKLRKLKTNGFDCPWHGYQIISWISVFLTLCCYFMILPSFEKLTRVFLIIIIFILLIIVVILMIISTIINPTDTVVIESRKAIVALSSYEQKEDEIY